MRLIPSAVPIVPTRTTLSRTIPEAGIHPRRAARAAGCGPGHGDDPVGLRHRRPARADRGVAAHPLLHRLGHGCGPARIRRGRAGLGSAQPPRPAAARPPGGRRVGAGRRLHPRLRVGCRLRPVALALRFGTGVALAGVCPPGHEDRRRPRRRAEAGAGDRGARGGLDARLGNAPGPGRTRIGPDAGLPLRSDDLGRAGPARHADRGLVGPRWSPPGPPGSVRPGAGGPHPGFEAHPAGQPRLLRPQVGAVRHVDRSGRVRRRRRAKARPIGWWRFCASGSLAARGRSWEAWSPIGWVALGPPPSRWLRRPPASC